MEKKPFSIDYLFQKILFLYELFIFLDNLEFTLNFIAIINNANV